MIWPVRRARSWAATLGVRSRLVKSQGVGPPKAARTSGEPARGRRQLTLGDLVEQRLVADLQDPGCLGAIPAHALQHLRERVPLGLARAPTRDLPQALADRLPGLRDRGWAMTGDNESAGLADAIRKFALRRDGA